MTAPLDWPAAPPKRSHLPALPSAPRVRDVGCTKLALSARKVPTTFFARKRTAPSVDRATARLVVMAGLHSLTDDTLLSQLGAFTAEDHRVDTTLLRLIEEIDKRRLWAELGYPSMFALCVERFRMSESRAGKRIGVARLARRFPLIFELVESGALHLSGALALKPHLTERNCDRVLAAARGKTTKEIDALIAELWPREGMPTRVRALPRQVQKAVQPCLTLTGESGHEDRGALGAEPCGAGTTTGAEPCGAGTTSSDGDARNNASDDPASRTTSSPAARPPRADDPRPLSPRQFRLSVTIDEETHRELGRLQDLLAHQVPNGDPAIIVARALSALLAETLKKKAALTDRPRQPAPAAEKRTRTVSSAVRREVWQRDEARCAFVAADGRRCNSTRDLQYAHLEPWAKGGGNSASNISLRCRPHNDYEAVQDYGESFMDDKRRGPSRAGEIIAPYLRMTRARDARSRGEARRAGQVADGVSTTRRAGRGRRDATTEGTSASADYSAGGSAEMPASRRSARSASTSGFPVVRSFSP
jgi:hypothetical protein